MAAALLNTAPNKSWRELNGSFSLRAVASVRARLFHALKEALRRNDGQRVGDGGEGEGREAPGSGDLQLDARGARPVAGGQEGAKEGGKLRGDRGGRELAAGMESATLEVSADDVRWGRQ